MVNLDNITAVTKGKSDFIGHLTWYSVGKQLIEVNDLKNRLVQSGLDDVWMPNDIRPTDAFRRATKEVEQRKQTSNPNVFYNILVREVYSDQKSIQRNIVIETVDQNGKRLSYKPKSAVITLDKKNSTVSFVTDDPSIKEICIQAENKFNIYKSHYSAQQLRVMVNKILQSLAPTPVRKSGGIYFIPVSKSSGLNQLIYFINSLDNSEGYKVPVINSSDNRDMVSKKLYDHFESIFHDCRSKKNMKKGEIKILVDEANKMIKDYRNYKTIVAEETESIEEMIARLKSEVSRLMMDMKV